MSASSRPSIRLLALICTTLLASSTALADKGGKHGHDHGHDHGERHEERYDDRRDDRLYRDDRDRGSPSIEIYFGDSHRSVIHDYYGPQFSSGHCPPGLAKKRNGCVPPGQAKKWQRGRPLPSSVVYFDLPRDLAYRMPPPPRGHRYVRVGSDILLITLGGRLVVDAIVDIGGY